MTHPYWPFFDLRLRTGRVELRLPTDDVLVELAALAARGVHDPATMPFMIPWTRETTPALERGALRWWWHQRAGLAPEAWSLGFAVAVDGEVVGMQDLNATGFPVRRTVATGSWLGREHQGQGLGTEMRAAVLHLTFAGLGAELATTSAWHDNLASQGVTRALGYVDDGESIEDREGVGVRQVRFRLDRRRWEATRRHEVEIEGLDACLPLLGAGEGGA